jgi:hypothetical protein
VDRIASIATVKIERISEDKIQRLAERLMEPRQQIRTDRFFKDSIVPTVVVANAIEQLDRNRRCRTSEIKEVIGDQDAISAGVNLDVVSVGCPVRITVM